MERTRSAVPSERPRRGEQHGMCVVTVGGEPKGKVRRRTELGSVLGGGVNGRVVCSASPSGFGTPGAR